MSHLMEIIFDFINPDSVLSLCNRAIDLDPLLSDPYVTRALYYVSTDTTAAVRDFEHAISNGPHLSASVYLDFWTELT